MDPQVRQSLLRTAVKTHLQVCLVCLLCTEHHRPELVYSIIQNGRNLLSRHVVYRRSAIKTGVDVGYSIKVVCR